MRALERICWNRNRKREKDVRETRVKRCFKYCIIKNDFIKAFSLSSLPPDFSFSLYTIIA